jgi:hypothetical protein
LEIAINQQDGNNRLFPKRVRATRMHITVTVSSVPCMLLVLVMRLVRMTIAMTRMTIMRRSTGPAVAAVLGAAPGVQTSTVSSCLVSILVRLS